MSAAPRVGPVLHAVPRASAVVAAIRALNVEVVVLDRSAYLRVLVPRVCRVTRDAIEREGGFPFVLPGDLEQIMPSFQGRFRVDEDEAIWWTDIEESS
jgi:toluene monooxygenase system protein D